MSKKVNPHQRRVFEEGSSSARQTTTTMKTSKRTPFRRMRAEKSSPIRGTPPISKKPPPVTKSPDMSKLGSMQDPGRADCGAKWQGSQLRRGNRGLQDRRVGINLYSYHPCHVGEVLVNRYVLIQKLGWGHFSTVWLAKDFKYGNYASVKIMKSSPHYL